MIPFAAYIQGLGLSQAEAARYVEVRPDTMASWCNGRRTPAPRAIAELHGLAAREQQLAAALAAAVAEGVATAGGRMPESIDWPDLDRAGAEVIGLPSVGAYRAVIRRIWEILPAGASIRLVDAGDEAVAAARRIRQLVGA